jgi:hypothetical protein
LAEKIRPKPVYQRPGWWEKPQLTVNPKMGNSLSLEILPTICRRRALTRRFHPNGRFRVGIERHDDRFGAEAEATVAVALIREPATLPIIAS